MSRLAVIIVNYRTPKLVVDCLRSLAAARVESPDFQVILVENASQDGSAEELQTFVLTEAIGDWVEIVLAGRNAGFGSGNNIGIRRCLASKRPPDYLLFLNPDTILHSGAIPCLLRFMDLHDEAGIVGGTTLDVEGTVHCSAHRFHSAVSELDRGARLGLLTRLLHLHVVSPPQPQVPTECDWVSGAFFMIRKRVAQTVGLFDEGYFLYFEEVDYCWRAKRAGWQVWAEPAAVVTHLEGQSTSVNQRAQRRGAYWYDSRRRFLRKAYGWSGLLVADLLWCLGKASFAVRRIAQRRADVDPVLHTWDIVAGDLLAALQRVLTGAAREDRA